MVCAGCYLLATRLFRRRGFVCERRRCGWAAIVLLVFSAVHAATALRLCSQLARALATNRDLETRIVSLVSGFLQIS
jgi:hypothetical protein